MSTEPKISIPMETKKPDRMSTIQVSKEMAKKFSVGEKIKVTVSGEVKGIRECYDDKNLYDVDIRNPQTDGIESSDNNSADEAMKEMAGQDNG